MSNGFKILVVDDEQENLSILQKYLVLKGHQVDTTVNGYHALEMIKNNHYDLFVLDLMMDPIGGFDLLKKLRENEVTQPIISLSGCDDGNSISKCFSSGFNEVIHKPVNFKAVDIILKKYLSCREKYREPC